MILFPASPDALAVEIDRLVETGNPLAFCMRWRFARTSWVNGIGRGAGFVVEGGRGSGFETGMGCGKVRWLYWAFGAQRAGCGFGSGFGAP